MSDIQDLIHKQSMDCIEIGKQMEYKRIVELLTTMKVIRPSMIDKDMLVIYSELGPTDLPLLRLLGKTK